MEFLHGLAEWMGFLSTPLFKVGGTSVSVLGVAELLLSVLLLFWVAGRLRHLTADRLLARTHLDRGTRMTIGSLLRYVVLIVGMMIIMQTAGIKLTALNVLAGAVGVGVGFGLQDIVKNFISGLIIMFDRTVKLGDRISITGVEGDIVDVGARRSTMTTPDGIIVIIPNSKFMTENVLNIKKKDGPGAVKLAVAVSRDSDPRVAEKLLYEVVRENARVVRDPKPFVRLNMPTAGAFPFEVELWTQATGRERDQLLNELHFALHEKLQGRDVQLAGARAAA